MTRVALVLLMMSACAQSKHRADASSEPAVADERDSSSPTSVPSTDAAPPDAAPDDSRVQPPMAADSGSDARITPPPPPNDCACGNDGCDAGWRCDCGQEDERCCPGRECNDGLRCEIRPNLQTYCIRSGVPPRWICPSRHYNANDGCHCECGTYDPDCNDSSDVIGCSPGQTCSTGTCE